MNIKAEHISTKELLNDISLNCSFFPKACAEINDRIVMPEEPSSSDPITANPNPIAQTVQLINEDSTALPLPEGSQLTFNIPLSNLDEQFVTVLKVFSNQISRFLKSNLREPQKIGYKAQTLEPVRSEEFIRRVYTLQDKLRTLAPVQTSPQDSSPFFGEFQKEALNALAEFLRYAESTNSTQEVSEEEQHRFFLHCLQLRHNLISISETFRIEALQDIINSEISQITQQTPSLSTATTQDLNQDSASQKTYERTKQFALQNHHNFLILCQKLKNTLNKEIKALREFNPSTAFGFRQNNDTSPSLLETLNVLNQASEEISTALEDVNDTTPVGANLRLLNSSLLTKVDALRVAIIRREYDKGIAPQEIPDIVYLLTEALDSIVTFENSYKDYLEKLKAAQQKAA